MSSVLSETTKNQIRIEGPWATSNPIVTVDEDSLKGDLRALVSKMLKAIHAQESLEASVAKVGEVVDGLDGMRLPVAARTVREGHLETLTYAQFPPQHWARIRTSNAIEERLNR